MASPIEEVYEKYRSVPDDGYFCPSPEILSRKKVKTRRDELISDLWLAIKAELALREKAPYTENSVDFPTPGHIFPFETKHPDPPHLIASECPCKPQRNSEGYWVHRKRNFIMEEVHIEEVHRYCPRCGLGWIADQRPSCNCPGLDGDSPGSDCADPENWPYTTRGHMNKLTYEQMEAAFYLVAADLCFLWDQDEGGRPFLASDAVKIGPCVFSIGPNLNDTFYYACADTEEIPWDEVVPLAELVRSKPNMQDRNYCLVNWAARKRNEVPQIPKKRERLEEYRAKYPEE